MKLLTIAKEAAACQAAFDAAPGATWAWHLHHETLCEPLRAPAAERIAYILNDKPIREQALRVRLFRPVLGALPEPLVTAWAAYETAWAAYETAWAASETARAAYETARAAYLPAIEALHAIECPDCPWDGRSIFA